jgi:sugar lactone lactonase YvrE
VYVADSGNHRVQKFGPSGTFMSSIGQAGSMPGQFNTPSGVALDATGNLYVADTGNNRIQKFDPGGNFIVSWGSTGSGNGQFNQPLAIAIDFGGNVYVADSSNYRVQKFDSNGAFLAKWGSQGSGNGQFNPPYGIAVSSSGGAVFVADNGGHRIQQFGPTGTFVFSFGVLGSGDGEFRFPSGVAVGSADRVYVADTNNHRVQRFITSGAAIVAVKDSLPDDAQDFTFTAGGGLSPPSFVLDDDGNANNGTSNSRAFGVDPGSGYSLAESTPAGWDLTSSTCSDESDPSNIDVSPDEIVTCTFTNRKRGRIIVVQDSTPNDAQDFSFTVGGGSSPSSFSLDDDGDATLSNTQVIDNVVPGSGHSVSQATPAGWGAAQTSCSDGSPVANIDVSPGETVTCTFSNLSNTAGRIVIVKDADPNDPQDFSFITDGGLSPGNFQLDDDGNNGNGLSNTREFIVSPQSGYSVEESVPAGWHSSASCSDGSPTTNIDVGPSETVTCTFLNRRAGSIVVVKDAQPNDDQDFGFTAGGGLSPPSFQLDDDGNDLNGLAHSRAFTNLAPGSGYSIAESVPAGWVQTGATCSDGSPISNIDVGPNETVTCTFTNLRQAGIAVVKDAQPDDTQDFSFTAGGGLSPSSFQLDDDGDDSNTLAHSRFFDSLPPGSGYSISETPVPGWDTTATCSDGSDPSNITLSTSELVTCTFTNRKHGSITLNLDTRPDDPQDFGFTSTGGLSPSSFTLDDDGDNGNGLSNTISFSDVSPGHYSLDQTTVPGWVQEDGSCSNGSDVSNITLAPGQNITCTVVTSTKAKIVVVKDARPNAIQDFTFTAGGGLSPASFALDDDANEQNTLQSRRVFIVDPASGYSVVEDGPPLGWRLSSATCSDGSPTTNITVVAGEAVTCTFVNFGDAYVRPKGASPMRIALVPAYQPCTASNRTHGPPLAFPSCNPPVQVSNSLTPGSPDANGAAANFVGSVRLSVVRGPAGPPDDSDVQITGSLTDVRCKGGVSPCPLANAADGADYAGQLRMRFVLRLTDRGLGDIPATVADVPFAANLSCVTTTSTTIGGTCGVTTSADAVLPGSVPEGERSIWQIDQIEVWDGGPDGSVATASGDRVYLREGVFVP